MSEWWLRLPIRSRDDSQRRRYWIALGWAPVWRPRPGSTTASASSRPSGRRDADHRVATPRARRSRAAPPRGARAALAPTGLPEPVADRRWWCLEHRHLAGPDDDLPPDDLATIGPHFELIPAPSDQAAMQAKDERRREAEERRRRERAAEAEAIRKAEERYYEEHRDDPYVNPLSGPGWAGIT